MLVLSRRPQEKILFPGTGISIEIVKTKGNTVRVGIEAPSSVRILRGEIASPEDLLTEPLSIETSGSSGTSNEFSSLSCNQRQRVERQLDEIYLAIALAQNQNRQDLPDNVGFALDEAMERLSDMKKALKVDTQVAGAVREPTSSYAVKNKVKNSDAFLVIDPATDNARFEFETDFSNTVCCVE